MILWNRLSAQLALVVLTGTCTFCTIRRWNESCPDRSQRRFQQTALCNTSFPYYICLNNTNNVTYVYETCDDKTDFAPVGQKYVLSGRFDDIDCPPDRYQPYNLYRSDSHECQFLKSTCNELGQILHSNGSTDSDVSCQCDAAKGYKLIKKTNNGYCVPSEEDCSCYLVLNSTTSDISCTEVEETTPISVVLPNSSFIDNPTYKLQPSCCRRAVRTTVLVIFLVMVAGFMVLIGLVYLKPSWFYEQPETVLASVGSPNEGFAQSPTNEETTLKVPEKPIIQKGIPSESLAEKITHSRDEKMEEESDLQEDVVDEGLVEETSKNDNSASSQIHTTQETSMDTCTTVSSIGSSPSPPSMNDSHRDTPSTTCITIATESPSSTTAEVCRDYSRVQSLPASGSCTPSSKKNKEKETCQVGNSYSFKCIIVGDQNLTVEPRWFFKGIGTDQLIPCNDPTKYVSENEKMPCKEGEKVPIRSKLTVNVVNPNDAGLYECRSEDSVKCYKSTNLYVEIPDHQPPIIKILSKNPEGFVGSVATIICSVDIPISWLKSVEWFLKRDHEHQLDLGNRDKYSVDNTDQQPSLTIHGITPKDAGNYFCRIETYGGEVTDSGLIFLTIRMEPPDVVPVKERYIETEKGTVTIECFVVSDDCEVPEIKWKFKRCKSGIILSITNNEQKYNITFKGIMASLTVKSLSLNDSGTYECFGRNTGGESSASIELIIGKEGPLGIAIVPDFQKVNLHFGLDAIIFWVLVMDSPKPKLVSVKNKDTGEEQKASIALHETQPCMFVMITVSMPGTYICCCEGKEGVAKVELLKDYKDNIDHVVAMDIGSMISKVAVSKLSDCLMPHVEKKHTEPTCLLFTNSDVIFGHEAKNQQWTTHQSVCENFISEICRTVVPLEHKKIGENQEKPASDAYFNVIKYFKDYVLNYLKDKTKETDEFDKTKEEERILWVLTLPVPLYKYVPFFLHCCNKAGIKTSRLLLVSEATVILSRALTEKSVPALEPSPVDHEATAIMPIAKTENCVPYLEQSTCEQVYLLVDFGGFSCKISAVKMSGQETVIVDKPHVWSIGGKLIDDKICDIIESIVKDRVIADLKNCKEFISEVENVKHRIEEDSNNVGLKIPIVEADKLCLKYNNKSFANCVDDQKNNKMVFFKDGLLYIEFREIEEILKNISQNIIEKIKEVTTECVGLVFVGGCSNIKLIKTLISENFSELPMICKEEIEPVKAALWYGGQPNVTISRQTQASLYIRWGPENCMESNKLELLLKKGSYIPIGETLHFECNAVYEKQPQILVEFFISQMSEKNTLLDGNFKSVFSETIRLAGSSTDSRFVDVFIKFGYDVLEIEITDRSADVPRQYKLPLTYLSSI